MMRGARQTTARLLALALAVLVVGAGCHGTARRTITGSSATSSGEPVLNSEVITPGTTGTTIVEPAAPAPIVTPQTVGFVDRHPLFRKPQQYYDNTNSNKFVKTAAATVVGVPAGIIGELKQIVVGKPSATTY